MVRNETEDWWVDNCTRAQADMLLKGKPDGTFLFRPNAGSNQFVTLSICWGNTIHHCAVNKTEHSFGLSQNPVFGTLSDLVQYYSVNTLHEYGVILETATLKYPVNTLNVHQE